MILVAIMAKPGVKLIVLMGVVSKHHTATIGVHGDLFYARNQAEGLLDLLQLLRITLRSADFHPDSPGHLMGDL